MKTLLFALLFISSLCTSQIKGTVTRIKDGDTFVFVAQDSTQHTIRVSGIDCPEKKQDFGSIATEFTSNALLGKQAEIFIQNKDQYGREVAVVFYGDNFKTNLSKELLRNGLAWHYKTYSKNKYLQSLENKARKDSLGLWRGINPIRPEEFRKKKQVIN